MLDLWRCAWLAIALLLGAVEVARAGGEVVVVVLGGEGRPYAEAMTGIRAELSERRPHARVLTVAAASRESALPRGQAYIALGEDAVRRIVTEGANPFVAGLVVNAHGVPRERGTAVSLDFEVEPQLRWLMTVLPSVRRLGVLYDPAESGERVAAARRSAARLGMEIYAVEVKSRADLIPALRSLGNRVDALWAIPDASVYSATTLEPILSYSLADRMPVFGLSLAWVKAGALAAPERDYADIGRQCSEYADALLAGVLPSALPVVAPRRFLYSINARSARYLRVEIPPSASADARHRLE